MTDEIVSFDIAANLIRLTKDGKLDDERVATALAESIAGAYGDLNQDDPAQSGDVEMMQRGVDVLEKALQQYEMFLQVVELQVSRKNPI